jgi:poly(3-hydroxyalkanoate) synthetase
MSSLSDLTCQSVRCWPSSWRELCGQGPVNIAVPATGLFADRGDKRFRDDAWHQSPYYDLLKQSYLLTSKQLSDLIDQAQVDDTSKLQLRFPARQFIDAMSPSNFPRPNPEVIRMAVRTRAASLGAAMQNLIEDVQKGRITRVDESAFEVGQNLAATPGSVVFENEMIQLIEYAPKTTDIEKTPLLIVPPCINKYYPLDLGAGNSFVEYAVAQGHHVFLISWRSAVAETQYLTWDDYLTLKRSALRAGRQWHVAGVINPPARNKRSYWQNDNIDRDANNWLEEAEEKPGSWWPDWDALMKRHSSGTTRAPALPGNANFQVIEPAPGSYVKQKSNYRSCPDIAQMANTTGRCLLVLIDDVFSPEHRPS